MFEKFIATITSLFSTRGGAESFKADEEIVAFVINALGDLTELERLEAGALDRGEATIATQGEITDIVTVRSAHEATLKDVIAHTVDALNRTRVLKAVSQQADLTQQFSDELWREADLLAADLELILDRCDPDELTGWLESRW
jgi:hypothetical protein